MFLALSRDGWGLGRTKAEAQIAMLCAGGDLHTSALFEVRLVEGAMPRTKTLEAACSGR